MRRVVARHDVISTEQTARLTTRNAQVLFLSSVAFAFAQVASTTAPQVVAFVAPLPTSTNKLRAQNQRLDDGLRRTKVRPEKRAVLAEIKKVVPPDSAGMSIVRSLRKLPKKEAQSPAS